ncbi:mitochondrial carrier domain-containing protein [Parasitella parasitica]|nr:mitochondrial carrier domain-containing protein [Parasitella parasitica]
MSYAANWCKDFVQTHETLKHSIAGAGAGVISSVVTCPLDVVKTRLQNQAIGHFKYRGTMGTIRRIRLEEGIRGLYRGLGPTVVGYLPTWAIYFTVYDYCKINWAKGDIENDWLAHISSAMTAGMVSTTLTSPVWVIKTRFMTQTTRSPHRYNTILEAFAMIAKHEGIRGFYKGLGPSLIGVSHVAIQFPLYERLKTLLSTNKSETTSILLASSVSKMVASTTTYPHEVIRTRLQNQVMQPFKYKVIMYEEGMRGFYKGITTNLVRTVPASAVTIFTYELIVKKLDTLRDLTP